MSEQQLTLGFDQTSPETPRSHVSLARTSDPETSKEAARAVNVNDNCRLFVKALNALGSATAREVERYWLDTGMPNCEADTVRKRQRDVVVKGVARIIAHRTCKVTGKTVGVYEAIR